ncbi:selenocysteinyl-tRNA-specific translation factor [Streptomyces sp. OM5714]|nr:selenocysteinyl-tRNA-specific translation factor [Streptomyces sp. OM5714]
MRCLHRLGQGGEDVGTGHRLGRAVEQSGDLRQHVVPGDAALGEGPVAPVHLVLDERLSQDREGMWRAGAQLAC